jgi:hypothetical protein
MTDSPREMEKKVEQYTYYLTLGVLALFIVIVILLVVQFLVGLLVSISMGG